MSSRETKWVSVNAVGYERWQIKPFKQLKPTDWQKNTQHPCERSRIQQNESVCALWSCACSRIGGTQLFCKRNIDRTMKATVMEWRVYWWRASRLWPIRQMHNAMPFKHFALHLYGNIYAIHTQSHTRTECCVICQNRTSNDKMSTIPTHFHAFCSRVSNFNVYIL